MTNKELKDYIDNKFKTFEAALSRVNQESRTRNDLIKHIEERVSVLKKLVNK